ncbi:CoA-binding protein [Gammaproteobacteria bacterium 45_16_T64]|nr:CoA-binding protein [Gammaproteobacteria bacterium 45_16_T64]
MQHSLTYQDSAIRAILENSHTIALVGASNKKHRASYRVMKFLQSKEYRVIPVNPKLTGSLLLGETVYGELKDIPFAVDMVDIFRNSFAAGQTTDEAIALSPSVIWMQLDVVNAAAADNAQARGIQVIMDRCPKIEYARLGVQHTPVLV